MANAGDKGIENAKILGTYADLFQTQSQDIRETLKNLASLLKKQSRETDPAKFIALEKHIRKVANKARRLIDTNYSGMMWNLIHRKNPGSPIDAYAHKDSWLNGVEDPFWVYVKVTGAITTYLNVLCEEAQAHEELEKLLATRIPFSKLAWRMQNIQKIIPKAFGSVEIEFCRLVAWLLFNARYAERSYEGFTHQEFKKYLRSIVSDQLTSPTQYHYPLPQEFNRLRSSVDKAVYEQLWIDVIASNVWEWRGDEELREPPASAESELELNQLQIVARINQIESSPTIKDSDDPLIRQYLESHRCPHGEELRAPKETLMRRFAEALAFLNKHEDSWKGASNNAWLSMIQSAYQEVLSPKRYNKSQLVTEYLKKTHL